MSPARNPKAKSAKTNGVQPSPASSPASSKAAAKPKKRARDEDDDEAKPKRPRVAAKVAVCLDRPQRPDKAGVVLSLGQGDTGQVRSSAGIKELKIQYVLN